MKDAEQPLGELGIGNLVAGAIVGGDYVATFLLHMGLEGPSYLMQEESMKIPTCRGCTPDIRQIRMALSECWESMHLLQGVDFGTFMLCLPSWCAFSKQGSAEVPIAFNPRIPWCRHPRVRARDVRRVVEAASETEDYESVAVDFVPRYFELASGRRILDPVGETSQTLSISASMMMADRGFIEGILNCLRSLCVQVSVITSLDEALYGCLAPSERERSDMGVLYVGRRHSTLCLFDRGVRRFSTSWDSGSENVIADMAENLSVTHNVVSSVVDQPELFIASGDMNDPIDSLPLFGLAEINPILKSLERAAGSSVSAMTGQVTRSMQAALQETGARVGRFVILGEDSLTLRLAKMSLEEQCGVPCRVGIPFEVHVSRDVELIGFAPIVGMVARHRHLATPPHQVFLDRYNETPLNLLSRTSGEQARAMLWGASVRVVSRLKKQKPAGTVQAVPDQEFGRSQEPCVLEKHPDRRNRPWRRRNRPKSSSGLRSYLSSLFM